MAQKAGNETIDATLQRACGPSPLEIISEILAYIPANNELRRGGGPGSGGVKAAVYVDGLLPNAVHNPSLLFLHYEECFNAKWSLEDIGKQPVKATVLEDASLRKHIRLRIKPFNDFSVLHPLTKYPVQWTNLSADVYYLRMVGFIDMFKSCLPRLEMLKINAYSVPPSGAIVPLQGSCYLKIADLSFNAFSSFFDSGLLNSITSLRLNEVSASRFFSRDAFMKALEDLPHVLSQLPCLYKLSFLDCPRYEVLKNLSRVNSASLHSLDVDGYYDTSVIAFLNLLKDCRIDCVGVRGDFLEGVERLFSDVRRIRIWVSLRPL